MPIEIRELIIKVKVNENDNKSFEKDLTDLKKAILHECKKEIKQQLKKISDK